MLRYLSQNNRRQQYISVEIIAPCLSLIRASNSFWCVNYVTFHGYTFRGTSTVPKYLTYGWSHKTGRVHDQAEKRHNMKKKEEKLFFKENLKDE